MALGSYRVTIEKTGFTCAYKGKKYFKKLLKSHWTRKA
jgi:hypothetical protein